MVRPTASTAELERLAAAAAEGQAAIDATSALETALADKTAALEKTTTAAEAAAAKSAREAEEFARWRQRARWGDWRELSSFDQIVTWCCRLKGVLMVSTKLFKGLN